MKKSAGILLFKRTNNSLSFFLVHPGGPFWKNKDAASWSIPKGEFTADENPLDAAIREFEEETGSRLSGDFMELDPVRLKSGKLIFAWALEQDIDADAIVSNTFEMEWPPKSGIRKSFPEVDKAGWFNVTEVLEKINTVQTGLIEQLILRTE